MNASAFRYVVAATIVFLTALTANAELPTEQLTVATLAPANRYRLYVADPAPNHLVDGRLHVVDGKKMEYLGMLGIGYFAQVTLSRLRGEIYVATTYYSRLQRGERSDVIEIYKADDLSFLGEIIAPPKHAKEFPSKELMQVTNGDRYLIIQNATPATSVSIVDLANRKMLTELQTPGCWGIIPWPHAAQRFSSICGDGRLLTIDFDEHGHQVNRVSSEKFFDPDLDPIFMHYEVSGNTVTFPSYQGKMYTAQLSGEQPTFEAPWSLLNVADKAAGWRPGGFQLSAWHKDTGRLYIGMHDRGRNGSHKSPAKQIWEVDMHRRKVTRRLPGHNTTAMTISQGAAPRLFMIDDVKNRLVSLDPTSGRTLLTMKDPLGDTSAYLEVE